MPNLPTYERKVGPERFAPYAPKQNFGDVIGEGVARLGEGLYQFGGAIARHKQVIETSQADREFGHAVNMVREHLNNFDLQLNEDDEFMLYEDKYKQLAERIATEIPETITTKEGKDRFALWWEEQSEINRFKIAKRAQDANLAWQAQSLQDDVNAIVSRADEYALDDLKSMLDGAKKNGLLTNDKYLAILNEGKKYIAYGLTKRFITNIIKETGEIEGREEVIKWLATTEAEKSFGIDSKFRKELRNTLNDELSDLKAMRKIKDDQELAGLNTYASDNFPTLKIDWVKSNFDPIKHQKDRERWIEAIRKRDKDGKGEQYKGSERQEGRLQIDIWSGFFNPAFMEQRINDYLLRGLNGDPDGIDPGQARTLKRELEKYQEILEMPGLKEAINILNTMKDPKDIGIRERSILALREYTKEAQEKNQAIDRDDFIQYAEKIKREGNDKNIQTLIEDALPPIKMMTPIEAERRELEIIQGARQQEYAKKQSKLEELKQAQEKIPLVVIDRKKQEWSTFSGLPISSIRDEDILIGRNENEIGFRNPRGDVFIKIKDIWYWVPIGTDTLRPYGGELKK